MKTVFILKEVGKESYFKEVDFKYKVYLFTFRPQEAREFDDKEQIMQYLTNREYAVYSEFHLLQIIEVIK